MATGIMYKKLEKFREVDGGGPASDFEGRRLRHNVYHM